MATIKGTYKGNLRNEMTHLQSGNTIITDAPTDNHGKGEAFSPTDLACAALAGCMMTIMGITAQTKGFNIDGATYEITKTMAAQQSLSRGAVHQESQSRNDYLVRP